MKALILIMLCVSQLCLNGAPPEKHIFKIENAVSPNYVGRYIGSAGDILYRLELNADSTYEFDHDPYRNNFIWNTIKGKWKLNENIIQLQIDKNSGFKKYADCNNVDVIVISVKKLKIEGIGILKKQ